MVFQCLVAFDNLLVNLLNVYLLPLSSVIKAVTSRIGWHVGLSLFVEIILIPIRRSLTEHIFSLATTRERLVMTAPVEELLAFRGPD